MLKVLMQGITLNYFSKAKTKHCVFILLFLCCFVVFFFFNHQSSKDTRIPFIDQFLNHRHDSFPFLQRQGCNFQKFILICQMNVLNSEITVTKYQKYLHYLKSYFSTIFFMTIKGYFIL